MNQRSNFLTTVSLSFLFFSGCVATTTDIDRLQDSLNTVQKSQADLIVKLGELDRSLTMLSEKLDENQKKTTTLMHRLDDVQRRLGGRMQSISELLSAATTQAVVPVPSEVYRTVYGDYAAGRLDLAISGFKSFLMRYPDSDLANSAQFYMADSFLLKKDFVQARIEFDKVLSMSQEWRAPALLKRAYALNASQQVEDQKATLQALIKEFPDSQEAQTAKQILKELEPKAKKVSKQPNNKKHGK